MFPPGTGLLLVDFRTYCKGLHMKFQAGESGNPSGLPRGQSKGGRPKGSVGGRMQALLLLDKILGKKTTICSAFFDRFDDPCVVRGRLPKCVMETFSVP